MLASASMFATIHQGDVYQCSTGSHPYYSHLPYNADGTYAINVDLSDDNSVITLQNWTSTEGENLALTINANGYLTAVNGSTSWGKDGSIWVKTTGINDNGMKGITVYGDKYSKLTVNADGSGSGYILVWSYADDGYRYVYVEWDANKSADDNDNNNGGNATGGDNNDNNNGGNATGGDNNDNNQNGNSTGGDNGSTTGGDPTAISEVSANANDNVAVYSLSGQRVGSTAKGIVIINGKKFLK